MSEIQVVIVAADETTGRAVSIERLSLSSQDVEAIVAHPQATR